MSVPGGQDSYEFGGFRLDPARRQLYGRDGEAIVIRTKVFDILLYLVERSGQLVTKSELMDSVWPRLVVEENNLNQAVSALRQCLGDDRQSPRFIATVTGRGYQFVAPVRRVPTGETQASAATSGAPPPGTPAPGTPAPGAAPAPAPRAAPADATSTAAPPRRAVGVAAAVVMLTLVATAVVWLWPRSDSASGPSADVSGEIPGLADAALVTDFPGSHSAPTLSPDGTMMAFVSTASGLEQIWITSLPRGAPVQITSGDRPATAPSWSPRNDQILFQRANANGVPAIWSIDPLGTTAPRLVIEVGSMPSFSANGEAFVYAIGRAIWIANADGTGRRRIEGVPESPGFEARRSPALSPAGREIAFVHAEEGPFGSVWLIPAAAGGEARPLLAAGGDAVGGIAADPVFSADGRHLIYTAASGATASTHLWRVPIGGGEAEQITGGVGGYGSPAVSPNGARLAYTNRRVEYRLFRTDPETGAHRQIHASRGPIVLPTMTSDGLEIAFFSGSTSGTQVFTIGADGGNRRQRTFDEAALNTLPVWSADDVWLYYYRNRSLHRLPRDGDRSEEVLPDFHWSLQHWLVAHGERIAFRVRNVAPEQRRTVVLDLVEGGEVDLPLTFSPTQWSRDGLTILGFSQEPDTRGQIFLCPVSADACRVLADVDGPILGTEPRWSMDETRVFFRRPSGRANHNTLWVADADGSDVRMLFEFGPFDVELSDSYFGVTDDDQIVWNQYDTADTEEIWVAGAGD